MLVFKKYFLYSIPLGFLLYAYTVPMSEVVNIFFDPKEWTLGTVELRPSKLQDFAMKNAFALMITENSLIGFYLLYHVYTHLIEIFDDYIHDGTVHFISKQILNVIFFFAAYHIIHNMIHFWPIISDKLQSVIPMFIILCNFIYCGFVFISIYCDGVDELAPYKTERRIFRNVKRGELHLHL